MVDCAGRLQACASLEALLREIAPLKRFVHSSSTAHAFTTCLDASGSLGDPRMTTCTMHLMMKSGPWWIAHVAFMHAPPSLEALLREIAPLKRFPHESSTAQALTTCFEASGSFDDPRMTTCRCRSYFPPQKHQNQCESAPSRWRQYPRISGTLLSYTNIN